MRSGRAPIGLIIILLFLTAVVGLFLVSYRYTSHIRGEERFLIYWAGMRNWLLNAASPYSDATASYIQALSVRSGESSIRVSYPLYGGIVFIPFAVIPDYALAQALWITTLGVAILLSGLICLSLVGWRSSVLMLALFLLLTVTGYPGLSLMISGNATILSALFLIAALEAIRLERDTIAGSLLAMSTIQPLEVSVVLLFILWWAISRRRWLLIIWFFGLLAVLTVIGAFFIPDWVIQWLRNLLHYSDYLAPANPRAAFMVWWPGIGRQVGLLFTLLLVISLISEWWMARAREFRWFLWTTGLTLTLAQWIGLPAGMENFVILVLPMAIFFSTLEERGGKMSRWINLVVMFIIYAGTWALYLRTSPSQLRPVMLFLPPLGLLLLSYYIRWRAIRPQRLFVDELKLHAES